MKSSPPIHYPGFVKNHEKGYHRLVATLYKQEKEIDIPELESQNSLAERSFSSRNFLIQNQDTLTPGAFAFSQGWLLLQRLESVIFYPVTSMLAAKNIDDHFLVTNIESVWVAFKIFSVKWDRTVQSTFHKRLQMPEPVYKYDQKDVFPIQVLSHVINSH